MWRKLILREEGRLRDSVPYPSHAAYWTSGRRGRGVADTCWIPPGTPQRLTRAILDSACNGILVKPRNPSVMYLSIHADARDSKKHHVRKTTRL